MGKIFKMEKKILIFMNQIYVTLWEIQKVKTDKIKLIFIYQPGRWANEVLKECYITFSVLALSSYILTLYLRRK